MSLAPVLTRESPFVRRLSAYLAERFPLLGHGVLIAAYYSSNQFLARTLTQPSEPMRYDLTTLLGALTLLCFFFHLRVFDEHKDYEEGRVHYPDRVLQRGLVTLRDLKILGGIAIAAEVALSLLRGPAAFVAWLFPRSSERATSAAMAIPPRILRSRSVTSPRWSTRSG